MKANALQRIFSSKWGVVLFIVLPLIPLWWFTYLPLQDYPNFYARYQVLTHYQTSPFYEKYFTIGYFSGILPLPYLTFDFFVLTLSRFFDIDTAMRLFLSLYVFMFILALIALAREEGLDERIVLCMNGPLIYCQFFFRANFNFVFIIPLVLFAVLVLERYRRTGSRQLLWVLSLLGILIYLTHLFGVYVLVVYTTVDILVRRPGLRKSLPVVAAILPSFALAVGFTLSGLYGQGNRIWSSLSEKFFFLADHLSYLPKGLYIIAAALFLSAVWMLGRKAYLANRVILVEAAVFLLLYLCSPRHLSWNAACVDARFLIFAYIFFSLAIRPEGGIRLLAGSIMIALVLTTATWFAMLSTDFNRNFSDSCADRMKPRSRVFAIDIATSPSSTHPYLHAWGYFSRTREIVTPFLFSSMQDLLKYREKPYSFTLYPWPIDKDSFPAHSAGVRNSYDYILLFGHDNELAREISSVAAEVCSHEAVTLYAVRN